MAPPQAERNAADGGEKAHEVCRPGRDKLSEGKFQSFLPYFLYFTKSRKRTAVGGKMLRQQQKMPPKGGAKAAKRQKDLIGLV